MTEHLPECPCPSTADDEHEPGCGATGLAAPSIRCCKGWPPNNCICDRLRACEERVTAAAVQRVGALFWFSDIAMRDQTHPDDYPWQPCLQLDGMCLSLGIWFASKDECDQFILSDVVRVGWKS